SVGEKEARSRRSQHLWADVTLKNVVELPSHPANCELLFKDPNGFEDALIKLEEAADGMRRAFSRSLLSSCSSLCCPLFAVLCHSRHSFPQRMAVSAPKTTQPPSKSKKATAHAVPLSFRRHKSCPSIYQHQTDLSTPFSTISLPAVTPHKPAPLWFDDDVNDEDLARAYGTLGASNALLLKSMDLSVGSKAKPGKFISIDCEMVGVGPDGVQSVLARVSVVNFHGATLLDRYVQPLERVTDFRTAVSGITPKLIANGNCSFSSSLTIPFAPTSPHLISSCPAAPTFKEVQAEVAALLKDRVLVGHAVENDLKVLLLNHPRRDIRDTSRYKPFRKLTGGRTPALRRLAKELLGLVIQDGEHSSIEDARVTMMLYHKVKDEWERTIKPQGCAVNYRAKKGKIAVSMPMATKRLKKDGKGSKGKED
ncbi:ribonuclease H-like domain-containing protein, partial [Endogone sp. FLAS-F59071]